MTKFSTLEHRQQQFARDAKYQLLEMFDVHRPTRVPRRVYIISRHTSRTGKKQTIEFLVFINNEPVYISARIAAVLRLPGVPEPPHSGIPLQHPATAASVIRTLSLVLYGKECLEVKEI